MPEQTKDYTKDWAIETSRWAFEEHHREWCADHFEFYKHFRNVVTPATDPDTFHSNIGVGLAYPIVKILSSRMMAPWQAGDDLIECTPRDPASKLKAAIGAAWINDLWTQRIARMFSKCELAKESGIALGRGILKPVVRWDPPMTILRRVQITLAQFGLGPMTLGDILAYKEIPSQPRLSLEYVDPFNFRWIGSTRFVEDCDFTVERTYLTTGECYRRIGANLWLPDVEPTEQDATGYDEYTERRNALEIGGMWDNMRGAAAGGRAPKLHRLVEIQGWCETKKKENGAPKYEQRIIQILDDKYKVMDGRLDTWNGKPGYCVWEPFYDIAGGRPMGVIEPMEQALLTLNDFVNIALDNARLAMESSLAIDPNSTLQNEILLGPGEINWIRNPASSMAPIPVKDLPRSFFELVGFFNDLLQRISGVSDYFGGMSTADTARLTKTARGMELMTQLSTSRFAPLLTKMDKEFYQPLARWSYETAKQRFGNKEFIRMRSDAGAAFQEVGPADFQADLDFQFNVKALDLATGRRRQEFLDMMDRVLSLMGTGQLQMQGIDVDLYSVVQILFSEFDRDEDADKIIKRVQQVAPMLPNAGPQAGLGGPQMPGRPMMPTGAVPPGAQPPGPGLPTQLPSVSPGANLFQ